MLKILELGCVATLAVFVAGCPGEPQPGGVGTVADSPQLADPPAVGTVAAGIEPVALASVSGSRISGEATINPRHDRTEIGITAEGAPAGSALQASIHPGRCESPGAAVAELERVEMGPGGRGLAQTIVLLSPQQVMDGAHVVVLHDDSGRPVACGEIPATDRTP
jgi:hypothetical protein